MIHYADQVTMRQIRGIPEIQATFVGSTAARMALFDKFVGARFLE
jgi:hypothetical protein